MIDDLLLETNVLEFVRKSFSYLRTVDWSGEDLAVFHRRETESESRFRPRVIDLFVVVPKEWVVYDPDADLLGLGKDGRTPSPRAPGTAHETAAEASRFTEQGIPWRRLPVGAGGYVYVPETWADRLSGPEAAARLGVATGPSDGPARP